MTLAKICVGLLMAVSVSGAATAGSSVTMQDREQAACFDDVQKLCGDLVPDVDRVAACMATKRQQVSPACGRFYDRRSAG